MAYCHALKINTDNTREVSKKSESGDVVLMFKMCRKIDLSKPGPAAPALAVKQT